MSSFWVFSKSKSSAGSCGTADTENDTVLSFLGSHGVDVPGGGGALFAFLFLGVILGEGAYKSPPSIIVITNKSSVLTVLGVGLEVMELLDASSLIMVGGFGAGFFFLSVDCPGSTREFTEPAWLEDVGVLVPLSYLDLGSRVLVTRYFNISRASETWLKFKSELMAELCLAVPTWEGR